MNEIVIYRISVFINDGFYELPPFRINNEWDEITGDI
jgi:hypothetical protein